MAHSVVWYFGFLSLLLVHSISCSCILFSSCSSSSAVYWMCSPSSTDEDCSAPLLSARANSVTSNVSDTSGTMASPDC
uniref:Putative secreted protein n=1 Tax=Anopheles darlingi TaxID=43151 RepID=A0A2M4DCI5_ANODA